MSGTRSPLMYLWSIDLLVKHSYRNQVGTGVTKSIRRSSARAVRVILVSGGFHDCFFQLAQRVYSGR